MATKIHTGLWLECKVCPHTPEELELRKREKRERLNPRRKRMDAGATLDTMVRRQVAYELGGPDAEPTKNEKFQVLQKYGVAAARIDRDIAKPSWMSETTWHQKRSEFYKATKGLVPREQFSRGPERTYGNQTQPRRPNIRSASSFKRSWKNQAPLRPMGS